MGKACSHLAELREARGPDELLAELLFLHVDPLHPPNDLAGEGVGQDSDRHPAEDHDEKDQEGGGAERLEGVRRLLTHDQHPLLLLQPGGGEEALIAPGVFSYKSPYSRVRFRFMDVVRVLGQEVAAGAACGLENSLGIQDVGFPCLPDAYLFHQFVEHIGVDGRPDHPRLSGLPPS